MQMSLNGVCIRSVFEQKIGPYKVCIFVNVGPFGKVAALGMMRLIILLKMMLKDSMLAQTWLIRKDDFFNTYKGGDKNC